MASAGVPLLLLLMGALAGIPLSHRRKEAPAHFLMQAKSECRFLNGTQRVRYLSRYFYDRQEILHFDSDHGEFGAVAELGEAEADRWNRDEQLLQYQKTGVDRCRYNYGALQGGPVLGRRAACWGNKQPNSGALMKEQYTYTWKQIPGYWHGISLKVIPSGQPCNGRSLPAMGEQPGARQPHDATAARHMMPGTGPWHGRSIWDETLRSCCSFWSAPAFGTLDAPLLPRLRVGLQWKVGRWLGELLESLCHKECSRPFFAAFQPQTRLIRMPAPLLWLLSRGIPQEDPGGEAS